MNNSVQQSGISPRMIQIASKPVLLPSLEKIQRHPAPTILRRVAPATSDNPVRVIVINKASVNGTSHPSAGVVQRTRKSPKITPMPSGSCSFPINVVASGSGPGNLVAQTAGEKRLVRKFCLVSPHKKVVSNADPPNLNRIRFSRPRYNPDEIPKLGRPMKIPIPRILKTEYNKVKSRTERIIVIPSREVRVTEAQTQTEPSELQESSKESSRSRSPRLVLLSDKGDKEMAAAGATGAAGAAGATGAAGKRGRIPNTPPQGVPPDKKPCLTPDKKPCLTPAKSDTPTLSEDGDVLQSLLDQHTTLLDIGNSNTDFLNYLLKTRESTTPVRIKTLNTEQLLQRARVDFEMCMVTDHMGNLSLHRAVVTKNLNSIHRQCIVLKAYCGHIDVKNNQGVTGLQLALIQECSVPVIQKLIQFGASLEACDNRGNTALHLAVSYSTPEVLCFLIPLMQDSINKLNEEGLSALHIASIEGKMEQTNLLVKYSNTEVNLGDGKSGRTPLFHALEGGHTGLARILVKHGGCRQVSNFAGQSIMTLGAENFTFKRAIQQVVKTEILNTKVKKPKKTYTKKITNLR